MNASILTLLAFIYFLTAFFLQSYTRRLNSVDLRWARLIMSFGLISHWVFFLWEIDGLQQVSLFAIDLVTTAIIVSFLWLMLVRKYALSLVLFALPVLSLFLVLIPFYQTLYSKVNLPSLWLWTHIALMVMGEVMFFLSAIAGSTYLFASRQLKKKTSVRLLTTISLSNLDQIISRLVWSGIVLLTAGVLLGLFFAEKFWVGSWWYDAKVIFAGATWAVYFFILVLRKFWMAFRGRRSAIAVLLAFFAILFLSMGVDYFFHSRHSELREDASSL